MWIWQRENWPHFTWDKSIIEPLLRTTRLNQGKLLGKTSHYPQSDERIMLDTLVANIMHSSAIEGVKLNAHVIRSSLSSQIGFEQENVQTKVQADGLAEIMIDAVVNWNTPLALNRLLNWHKRLMNIAQPIDKSINLGRLRGKGIMQVVSKAGDKTIVHFEAPDQSVIDDELTQFLMWFNDSRMDPILDPFLRAAISHLWFITLHPFDDGNGRIARLLTDLVFAQGEHYSVQLFAMPVSIFGDRKGYYDTLEKTQKGDTDITSWLMWFIQTLNSTLLDAMKVIDKELFKTKVLNNIDQPKLSTSQLDVLLLMLEGKFKHGINTTQYHALTKVSKPTASRHLAGLVKSGALIKTDANGRSTKYMLRLSKLDSCKTKL